MINNVAPYQFNITRDQHRSDDYINEAIRNGTFSKVYTGTIATIDYRECPLNSVPMFFVETPDLQYRIVAQWPDVDPSISPQYWPDDLSSVRSAAYVGQPVTFQIWRDETNGAFAFNVNPIA